MIIAALLAPDAATTITLLIAAGVFGVAVLLRNKSLTRIMDELASLIASRGALKPTSSSLDRSLLRLHRHLLLLAAVAELVVFLTSILGNLDITTARNYALLILVSLSTLGLELELAVVVRGQRARSAESVSTAISYALEDAYALLAVIGLSLAGTLWLHIPPALSALQILFITLVARPLLSGSILQTTPHRIERRTRVFFTSIIVYGSFVFFFIRHYLEPRYADVVNPVTWQATTMAFITFIACQTILLAFNPKAPKVIAYRLALLLGAALLVTYLPVVQDYLMTGSLATADWVWVIVSGLLYAALCLLQYHSRKHNRKTLLGRLSA